MTSKEQGKWLMGTFIVLILVFIMGILVGQAYSQTPPISTVNALPDTSVGETIFIDVTVESSIPWDNQFIGLYYRMPGTTDWLYIGATVSSIDWTPPVDGALYEFASQVDDNEGNSEPYPHELPEPQAEAFTVWCMSCPATDCPPTTPLQAIQILAAAGFDLEPDTPKVRWWWTHPTEGGEVDEYEAEWCVDGTISLITGIAAMSDSTYAFWDAPYASGQEQSLRVRGKNTVGPGEFSLWSDPWSDAGLPGSPGAPNGALIMVD
jgi:hypothetical protein